MVTSRIVAERASTAHTKSQQREEKSSRVRSARNSLLLVVRVGNKSDRTVERSHVIISSPRKTALLYLRIGVKKERCALK